MSINQEFKKRFDELADGYYEIRDHVSAFQEDRENLKVKLQIEIDRHEPWRTSLMDELGQITSNFCDQEKAIHKSYIRQTPYFEHSYQAPYYRQIIDKPNGYAGDAEMMQIIYRNDFEGETPFGMFLHKQATSTAACQAVRNRKDFLVDQIRKLESGKVLSLAAGPAEEIMAFLSPKCGGGGKLPI